MFVGSFFLFWDTKGFCFLKRLFWTFFLFWDISLFSIFLEVFFFALEC